MPDFSEAEWRRIEEKLDGNETAYGLPRRNSKSVVLSFVEHPQVRATHR